MSRPAASGGTRLIMLRHGQTGWNREGRIQGQLDAKLDDTGRAQAAAVAERLAMFQPVAIVSSDLSRAADTAAPLAEQAGLPVRHDARLRERHFGEWQGLTMSEVASRYPAEYGRWRAGGQGPIGGCGVEEIDDLVKRVCLAVQEAAAGAGEGPVVVVTHGGAAKHSLLALLGWPPALASGLGSLGNCRWVELRVDPVHGWRMHGYNLW